MAEAFTMKFDGAAFDAELDAITAAAEESMRPAAQAGIQVFYDEVLLRVPVNTKTRTLKSGRVIPPGALKASIYQVFSKDNSGEGFATYHCSWNYRKAPHGHLVEFGTSRSPAHPFLRPAFDAAQARALKAAEAHITFAMQPALKGHP
jgi:HK97 gp10 family phage protein